MRKLLVSISAFILVMLTAFTATAFAAQAVTTVPDPDAYGDAARAVLDAVRGGHYAFAAVIALMVGVTLIRKYGSNRLPWLKSDAGGAALTLAASFFAALGASLAAGGTLALGMFYSAGALAVAAAGGYTLIKRLVIEPLRPWLAKLPSWCQPIVSLLLWVFDKPTPVEDAEKAGDAAVKSTPAAGAAGIVGKPDDVA